ncbi:MAG: hypothetical protein HY699_22780 [Deltaproteobacteria bacterium]|nr:hypothetical protein [Deltaproteobacteria bacterium]
MNDRALPQPAPAIALVVNPCALAGDNLGLWPRTVELLRRRAAICAELRTSADGANAARVAELVRQAQPEVIVAAGGDGTVSEVVQGIMLAAMNAAPALAIVPLGTANNVGRSLGLRSFRRQGHGGIALATGAILDGQRRRIDLGQAGERYFAGSFALGMDADILVTRNRLRRRLRLGRGIGGYPLYLWSCAVNLVRHRSSLARLRIDGADESAAIYNLLVSNAPIYAGEFRFDAVNTCDDGYLDLHRFAGASDYLRRYPQAWRRHLGHSRGLDVRAPAELQRVRELHVDCDGPVACQIDGEEFPAVTSYCVRVVPQGLTVCVPPGVRP